MRLSKRIVTALSAAFVLCMACPLSAPQTTMDFRQLLLAAKANSQKIESGRGTAYVRQVGYAPDGQARSETVFRAPFAFDGEKARYDHFFDKDLGSDRKFIVDGSRFIKSGPVVEGRPAPWVFIEPLDEDDQMSFSAWRVNPRRTMEPYRWDFDTTLRQLDLFEPHWTANEPLWRVSLEPDGQYKVVMRGVSVHTDDATGKMTLTSQDDTYDVYWFDPAQNFALTRDIVVAVGVTAWDTQREYKEISGAWAVTSVRHAHTIPSTKRLNGTVTLEYRDFETNVDIPESTFTIADFGFPPTTKVRDEIAGVEYTVGPATTLITTPERLVDAPEVGPSKDDQPDDQKPDAAPSQRSESAPGLHKRISVRMFLVAAIALAAFLLLVMVIYRRKTRAH